MPGSLRDALIGMCERNGAWRTNTAVHESGHVVYAHAVGGCGISVEIFPSESLRRENLFGRATIRNQDTFSDEEYIGLCVSGRMGEIEATKICVQLENDDRRYGDWQTGDLGNANNWLSGLRREYGDDSTARLKSNAIAFAQNIVRSNMPRIVFVAAELLRAGRLNIAETEAVLLAAPPLG